MNSDKPVIVNFHADWCEPCKILTPKLKELIEPLTNLDLAVVDVEDNADLVHTFEVGPVKLSAERTKLSGEDLSNALENKLKYFNKVHKCLNLTKNAKKIPETARGFFLSVCADP